jgi:dTDP-glucose 4,6-dehydratase
MNILFKEYQFDYVIQLAAESHMDKSITDSLAFAITNILGTMILQWSILLSTIKYYE